MVGMDSCAQAPAGTIEQVANVIERTPDILAKIKDLFGKKSKKQAPAEEAEKDNGETVEVEISND